MLRRDFVIGFAKDDFMNPRATAPRTFTPPTKDRKELWTPNCRLSKQSCDDLRLRSSESTVRKAGEPRS